MTRRAEVAERLARADPAGLLYGGIVTAAVLATVSAHAGQKQHVAVATFVVLVVYWLAHVYVATQAMQYEGDRRRIHQRLVTAALNETSVLKGGSRPSLCTWPRGSSSASSPGTRRWWRCTSPWGSWSRPAT